MAAVAGREARLRAAARRLITDAVAHYPAARIAAAGLDYRDATTVHRLIQTARLAITWPAERTRHTQI